MATNGSPAQDFTTEVTRRRRVALNEDWVATIVGLVLLGLVLTGVIPTGLVP